MDVDWQKVVFIWFFYYLFKIILKDKKYLFYLQILLIQLNFYNSIRKCLKSDSFVLVFVRKSFYNEKFVELAEVNWKSTSGAREETSSSKDSFIEWQVLWMEKAQSCWKRPRMAKEFPNS